MLISKEEAMQNGYNDHFYLVIKLLWKNKKGNIGNYRTSKY